MIKESPSEIYNAALALCPPSSWLHKHYPTKATRVKMIVGPIGWGACIRTVSCSHTTFALACWKHTVATCASHKDIAIYDTLTGSQTAILSGHTKHVRSLAFSSDGTLLISGGDDKTIKLWDIQTGGVAKTLYGHTDQILSVSISANSTMIASGSCDKTICLWGIETGDCHAVGKHGDWVRTVSFSPTSAQILLSSSDDDTVQQWNINGHRVGPPIAGSHVAFSSDGIQFVTYDKTVITCRDTYSKMTLLQFNVAKNIGYCYFSPNGRFIAVVADNTIYL